jgi:hypothetical protein
MYTRPIKLSLKRYLRNGTQTLVKAELQKRPRQPSPLEYKGFDRLRYALESPNVWVSETTLAGNQKRTNHSNAAKQHNDSRERSKEWFIRTPFSNQTI